MLPLKVAGLGVYLPERRETRDDFIRRGIPEDIIEELGVYERRIVADGQTAADMEVEAARMAIQNAGLKTNDIDLIMSATILPEMVGMPNSNLLRYRLGMKQVAAFDIGQACGAAIPGMIMAANFLALKQYRRILITTSTHWSVISDPDQPSADFVLGDGAAAIVLAESNSGFGLVDFDMQSEGRFYYNCGTRIDAGHKTRYYDQHNKKLLFYIDPAGVDGSSSAFNRYLLTNGPATFKAAMKKANMTASDIDCAIIHGNVKPVVRGWVKGMKVPGERFPLTYDRYGNVSVVTVLLNLHEGLAKGMIKRGDNVALVSQGAGFSAGAIIMRWE